VLPESRRLIGPPDRLTDVFALDRERTYGKAPPCASVALRSAQLMAEPRLPELHQHDAFEVSPAVEIYAILKDTHARSTPVPVRRQIHDQVGFGIG
jgi:hypothetical protein